MKIFTSLFVSLVIIFNANLLLAEVKKPNILYIVADDLGWKDLSYRNSIIKTPTIDKLATTGSKLEQFYVQPMCTPTRAALMTGRYPLRYGLQTGVIPQGHKYGLPTDEYLLPQALKEEGYKTAIIGKWHLGHADPKFWPNQRGFDYQYGPLIGEIDYFTHKAGGSIDWFRNNKLVDEKGYSTTLLGDDAVKYINEHNTNIPLFLYLAFNAPHAPYQATTEYLEKYNDIKDPSLKAYAGSITAMDDQIARVLQALEDKKMRNNTLIIFMSDNGGTSNPMFAGAITDMSKVTIPCNNGPYRDGKGSLYEGGTRVAAIANWPNVIPIGSNNELMHVVDIFPTLINLVGGSVKKSKPLDGVDIWNTLITGQDSPRKEIVYNVEPYRAAIRQGDWKLVWKSMLPSSLELYNLPKDPSEEKNLAAENPKITETLQERINILASEMAKPILMEIEFKNILERMHMESSLPKDNN